MSLFACVLVVDVAMTFTIMAMLLVRRWAPDGSYAIHDAVGGLGPGDQADRPEN